MSRPSLGTRLAIKLNPNMLRNFFSIYFWVTWVALSIASGLILLEAFRVVETTAELVILPKTETAMVAPGNAARLIASDSFQGRVERALVPADIALVSEAAWEESVTVTLYPGSSTLRLATVREERSQSERLMKAILKEIGISLSQWYNLETELDLRVITGPESETRVAALPWYGAATLGLAFGVTVLFFLILAFLERTTARAPRRLPVPNEYRITPETFQPSAAVPYWSDEFRPLPPTSEVSAEPQPVALEAAAPAEETQSLYQPELLAVESVFHEIEPAGPSETKRTPGPSLATGPAPDNLPIMEDLSPLEGATARLVKADIDATARVQAAEAEALLVMPAEEREVMPVKTGEPTQEDYKRRLNELLSGRM